MLAPEFLLWRTLDGLRALDPTVDEVAIAPSEVRYVAAAHVETSIRGRPFVPHPRIATITRGTRLVVRGVVESRDDQGCAGKPWYAVLPLGFVCSEHVRPTTTPPDPTPVLAPEPGRRLPHEIMYVREDGVPMYESLEVATTGTPSRTLVQGMSLVFARTYELDGEIYIQTASGELVPKWGVRFGGQGSEWSGVAIEGRHEGPSFAWVLRKEAVVFDSPHRGRREVDRVASRERVPLFESFDQNPGIPSRSERFYRVGENRWMRGADLNEVVLTTPPTEIRSIGEQWIDVDLGEQVLVLYRGEQPEFATLVSSGRGHPTPLGNYPIWAKVATMTMANQEYEDKPYMVQGVPWVLLFQGHNAIHGAYWHDRFGVTKSHGCINLSPLDARFVFDWAGPKMVEGWTGYLPQELGRSVLVHVRDSSKPLGEEFTQARPIGPPDREAEARKVEEARARREQEALATSAFPLPDGPAPSDALPEGTPPRLEPPPLGDITQPPDPEG